MKTFIIVATILILLLLFVVGYMFFNNNKALVSPANHNENVREKLTYTNRDWKVLDSVTHYFDQFKAAPEQIVLQSPLLEIKDYQIRMRPGGSGTLRLIFEGRDTIFTNLSATDLSACINSLRCPLTYYDSKEKEIVGLNAKKPF